MRATSRAKVGAWIAVRGRAPSAATEATAISRKRVRRMSGLSNTDNTERNSRSFRRTTGGPPGYWSRGDRAHAVGPYHAPVFGFGANGSAAGFDPDGLDVHELPGSVEPELASESRTFDSAEGEARVGSDHGINEDLAGLDLIDEAFAFRIVIGPGTGTQAETRRISNANRFRDVFDPEHRRDWAEDFFVVRRRILRDAGQDRGSVEVSGPAE